MNGVDSVALLAVTFAIALAATLPAVVPRLLLPGVVLEVLLGVLIGPQVLDLAHEGRALHLMSELGLGLLFLIAGFELNPEIFKGQGLRRACGGWVLGAALALFATFLLSSFHLLSGALLTAVALSTTAVGTLLPLLRDQGWLREPYGPAVLAAGSAGEALPLVVLSLILAGRHEAPWQAFLLVLFAFLAGGLIAAAGWIGKSSFGRLAERTMHLSGQLPLRLVILLLIAMVLLSEELNVDLVLAAFVSGAACRSALPRDLHESLQVKLDGVGYGLMIPIFFVVSGIRLDLATLISSPSCLLTIPLLVGIMFLARGVPALVVYREALDITQRKALALHCSTQLPLVVAISGIGVSRDIIPPDQAAAMVGAAVLSLILFPILAARYRPSPTEEVTVSAPNGHSPP